MTTDLVTCGVTETLAAAADRMWTGDIGALPVVDGTGVLVGMITDRDICIAALMRGQSLHDIEVGSAMSGHVVAAAPEANLLDIQQLMARYQLRRIPLVDREGRPVGIVSLQDIAREAVEPHTRLPHAAPKVTQTLAAIARPRHRPRKVA